MIRVNIEAVGAWIYCDVCHVSIQRCNAHSVESTGGAIAFQIGDMLVGLTDGDHVWCLCDTCHGLLVQRDLDGLVKRALSDFPDADQGLTLMMRYQLGSLRLPS